MLLGRDHVNGRSAGVTSVGAFLGGHLDIPHNPREREGLYEVFDSMDFDGKLSRVLFFFFVWSFCVEIDYPMTNGISVGLSP